MHRSALYLRLTPLTDLPRFARPRLSRVLAASARALAPRAVAHARTCTGPSTATLATTSPTNLVLCPMTSRVLCRLRDACRPGRVWPLHPEHQHQHSWLDDALPARRVAGDRRRRGRGGLHRTRCGQEQGVLWREPVAANAWSRSSSSAAGTPPEARSQENSSVQTVAKPLFDKKDTSVVFVLGRLSLRKHANPPGH